MDDPRLISLKRAFEAHVARPVERGGSAVEAAVSLVVRPRDQLELLLIKRAIHESDPWSGHMALPGGRRAASDPDLLATAMREAREEVGIPLSQKTDFIGALDEVTPNTRRLPPLLIAPFVFSASASTVTTIDTREVEAAIWVPLSALRDETAASEILIELEGGSKAFPSFRVGEYVIWGLTHRILSQFLEITVGL